MEVTDELFGDYKLLTIVNLRWQRAAASADHDQERGGRVPDGAGDDRAQDQHGHGQGRPLPGQEGNPLRTPYSFVW